MYTFTIIVQMSALSLRGTSTHCTCPGQTLTYECSVAEDATTTIWTGSAFDCSEKENQLIFLPSRARDNQTQRTCNRGDIVGHITGIVDNVFVTQLNITLNPSLDGKTVQCFYRDVASDSKVLVGNESIEITTGLHH